MYLDVDHLYFCLVQDELFFFVCCTCVVIVESHENNLKIRKTIWIALMDYLYVTITIMGGWWWWRFQVSDINAQDPYNISGVV